MLKLCSQRLDQRCDQGLKVQRCQGKRGTTATTTNMIGVLTTQTNGLRSRRRPRCPCDGDLATTSTDNVLGEGLATNLSPSPRLLRMVTLHGAVNSMDRKRKTESDNAAPDDRGDDNGCNRRSSCMS
jgi:hypothetical protein